MTKFIALCGYPDSGKSTAQRMISEICGAIAIDDAAPLREAVKILYGLTDWHVATQEGKASTVDIGGVQTTVRKLLGDLGDYLEDRDINHLPHLAIRRARAEHPHGVVSFGSVRKGQAHAYRATGSGLVIAIERDGCRPSAPFDEYDHDAVDVFIDNNGTPAELRAQVIAAVDAFLGETFVGEIFVDVRAVAAE